METESPEVELLLEEITETESSETETKGNSWTDLFLVLMQLIFSGTFKEEYKENVKPLERKLWLLLILAMTTMMIIPLIGLGISKISEETWPVALFGIIVLFSAMILTFKPLYLSIAALIGIVQGAIYEKKDMDDAAVKIGKKYIDFMFAIVLWEMIVISFIAIFPVHSNVTKGINIAFAALLIGIMIKVWKMELSWFRKLAFNIMVLVIIFNIGTMIFPQSMKAVQKKAPLIDPAVAGLLEGDTTGVKNLAETFGYDPDKQSGSGSGQDIPLPLPPISQYYLPADGRVIERSTDGHKIAYPKGVYFHVLQLKPIPQPEAEDEEVKLKWGAYEVVNSQGVYASWREKRREIVTGPTTSSGLLKIRSIDGNPKLLQVWFTKKR